MKHVRPPYTTVATALPEAVQQWFHGLTAEADRAGVPFRANHTKTVRRYELYRGLLTLARGEMEATTP